MRTFHGAAFGKCIQEKISPKWKTKHEVSHANDKSQRGHTWNLNISWWKAVSLQIWTARACPVAAKKRISQLQNFVQIHGPHWISIRSHNGSA
jgi:hypothetical protein